jgi:hypothetical protein
MALNLMQKDGTKGSLLGLGAQITTGGFGEIRHGSRVGPLTLVRMTDALQGQ